MAPTVSEQALPAPLPEHGQLSEVPERYRPLLHDLLHAVERYDAEADTERANHS